MGMLELGWFIAKFWLHVLKPDTWVKGCPLLLCFLTVAILSVA